MFAPTTVSTDVANNYEQLRSQAIALIESDVPIVTNVANLVALVAYYVPNLNWVGVYFLEGDTLYLGPFQGLPACTTIAMGKGVCGTAAIKQATMNVKDVHQFDGHIACDGASNSELVIPIVKDGELLGVLDIDSPLFDRFQAIDQEQLEQLVLEFTSQLQNR
jgi:L-methionine (R)-S-oxide reductase